MVLQNALGNIALDATVASTNTLLTNGAAVKGARPTATTGTITSAASTVGPVTVSGNNSAVVTFHGTFAGVNATLQGSNDGGTTWFGLKALNASTSALLASGATGVIAAATAYRVNVSGWLQFRVQATAWTSGTANVTIQLDGQSTNDVVSVGATGGTVITSVTGYPTAAAAADAYANPTITHVGSDQMMFNGTTWDRQRNNVNVNVDTSAAKTTTVAGTTATNYNASSMAVAILVTAVSGTTPTLVAKLQWSPDNGTTWVDWDTTNLQTASITTTGTYVLKVYPGATNAANSACNDFVPRTWRVYYTITGTTPSFTLASWAAYTL